MKTHDSIDNKSILLAQAVVKKIDADPERGGILKARLNCQRWLKNGQSAAIQEWLQILNGPWEEIRSVLLDPSESGRRLRQSNPFCGIISNRERWNIYKEYQHHENI